MIHLIDHGPLHELLQVVTGAARTGNYAGTEDEATRLLERVITDAHAGNEPLQAFLEDTLGEIPDTISGATLNTIVEAIPEVIING